MRELSFIINCNPPKHTAQGGKRILKTKDGRFFIGKKSNSKAQQTENELLMLLYPYRPEKPFLGALEEKIRWVYPYRKSEPKKNIGKEIWCDTRSDCDNLVKMFNDCLTRLNFWKDDGQVAILHFEKLYDEKPRIEVDIKELL